MNAVTRYKIRAGEEGLFLTAMVGFCHICREEVGPVIRLWRARWRDGVFALGLAMSVAGQTLIPTVGVRFFGSVTEIDVGRQAFSIAFTLLVVGIVRAYRQRDDMKRRPPAKQGRVHWSHIVGWAILLGVVCGLLNAFDVGVLRRDVPGTSRPMAGFVLGTATMVWVTSWVLVLVVWHRRHLRGRPTAPRLPNGAPEPPPG